MENKGPVMTLEQIRDRWINQADAVYDMRPNEAETLLRCADDINEYIQTPYFTIEVSRCGKKQFFADPAGALNTAIEETQGRLSAITADDNDGEVLFVMERAL